MKKFSHAMILFYIFLILKLTGHIDWAWGYVMTPLIVQVSFWVAFGPPRDD